MDIEAMKNDPVINDDFEKMEDEQKIQYLLDGWLAAALKIRKVRNLIKAFDDDPRMGESFHDAAKELIVSVKTELLRDNCAFKPVE